MGCKRLLLPYFNYFLFHRRFRWVFCQIEVLRGCFPPALRRALEELPKSLDSTYERILLGIETAKRVYAYRLLQCLTVSVRPLCVEELAEVFAVRVDDAEDAEYDCGWRPEDARQAVLSACSTLITIVNFDGSPVVQFSHFSVKEFLMSSRLANAGEHLSRYHILPLFAHLFISRASLSVLLNLGSNVVKSVVEKRPFAIYAARYWIDHTKFEGVSLGIQDLMRRLFDPDAPYFATWVWIYDVDRPWKGLMPTMQPTKPEAKPLYYAALCGFHSLVKYLTIIQQQDVNARGGDHGTALNAALARGELEIARTLLQNGTNVNTVDTAGFSSLYRAAQARHRAVVELLLEHQIDVNFHAGHETPLHVVAQNGELNICGLLLKHGAYVSSKMQEGWTALHVASRYGHSGIVEELLVHGADVNDQKEDLWTSLHLASTGHLEIVQTLVRHSAALDKTNANQETALHIASGFGNLDIACFLIERGADLNCCDKRGCTPLHAAACNGHLDIVRLLLDHGLYVQIRNGNNETPLILASLGGHLEVSQYLIEHNAGVNSFSDRGWTPLHSASQNGHANVVQLLLNNGASINAQTVDLRTPLHLASAGGYLKVAELLIGRGAGVDVQHGDEKTPSILASGHGELEDTSPLIKPGSNVNSQDNTGCTPSHAAARNGHLSLVELLLDSGANIDIRNKSGDTPFDLAKENRKLDVAGFLARLSGNLCALDVDCSAPSKAGLQDIPPAQVVGQHIDDTPSSDSDSDESNSLHSASVNGRVDLVRRLLDGGADVNERDELLQTPLDVASRHGKLIIAGILLRYGADVNSRDNIGWTPLHTAARRGHIDVVQLLLDNGADVNATTREGETAMHIASSRGNLEVVRSVFERGANVKIRNVYGRTPSQHALLFGYQNIVQFLSQHVGASGV